MVELMKMMVTSFQRSRACTATLRAPTLQQAAADPHLPGDSWTLPGESGSVSRGVPAPFSWVLVHKVCLCPPRVRFPVLGKFSWLYGGVSGDLHQEGLCHSQVCCTQSPCPAAVHCRPIPPQETLTHRTGSVSVGSPGLAAYKACLSPPSISGRYGV